MLDQRERILNPPQEDLEKAAAKKANKSMMMRKVVVGNKLAAAFGTTPDAAAKPSSPPEGPIGSDAGPTPDGDVPPRPGTAGTAESGVSGVTATVTLSEEGATETPPEKAPPVSGDIHRQLKADRRKHLADVRMHLYLNLLDLIEDDEVRLAEFVKQYLLTQRKRMEMKEEAERKKAAAAEAALEEAATAAAVRGSLVMQVGGGGIGIGAMAGAMGGAGAAGAGAGNKEDQTALAGGAAVEQGKGNDEGAGGGPSPTTPGTTLGGMMNVARATVVARAMSPPLDPATGAATASPTAGGGAAAVPAPSSQPTSEHKDASKSSSKDAPTQDDRPSLPPWLLHIDPPPILDRMHFKHQNIILYDLVAMLDRPRFPHWYQEIADFRFHMLHQPREVRLLKEFAFCVVVTKLKTGEGYTKDEKKVIVQIAQSWLRREQEVHKAAVALGYEQPSFSEGGEGGDLDEQGGGNAGVLTGAGETFGKKGGTKSGAKKKGVAGGVVSGVKKVD